MIDSCLQVLIMSAYGISSCPGTQLKTFQKSMSNWGRLGERDIGWKLSEKEFEVPFWGAKTILCLNKIWVTWIWAFVNTYQTLHMWAAHFAVCRAHWSRKDTGLNGHCSPPPHLIIAARPGSGIYLYVQPSAASPSYLTLVTWLHSFTLVSKCDSDLNTPPVLYLQAAPHCTKDKIQTLFHDLTLRLHQDQVLVY